MNKFKRIIAFLHIFILFYFTLIIYSTSFVTSSTTISKSHSTGDESCFVLFSSDLFCPTAQTQNIVKDYNELSSISQKNHFKSFVDRCRAEEALLLISFSKYVFYSIYLAERFQPTDIIFPFHNFW